MRTPILGLVAGALTVGSAQAEAIRYTLSPVIKGNVCKASQSRWCWREKPTARPKSSFRVSGEAKRSLAGYHRFRVQGRAVSPQGPMFRAGLFGISQDLC